MPNSQQNFKRISWPGYIVLLAGILFLVTTFLRIADSNPYMVVSLIAAVLFLGNGIWMITAPYVIISANYITVKQSLLISKTIPIDEIKEMVNEGDKRWYIYFGHGTRVKIQLSQMAPSSRKTFLTAMHQLEERISGNKQVAN